MTEITETNAPIPSNLVKHKVNAAGIEFTQEARVKLNKTVSVSSIAKRAGEYELDELVKAYNDACDALSDHLIRGASRIDATVIDIHMLNDSLDAICPMWPIC